MVLSSGSNDAGVPGLAARLSALRGGIVARQVLWILPYDRGAAATVHATAVANGDRWIDLAPLPTRDGIHPRSYAAVARALVVSGAVPVSADAGARAPLQPRRSVTPDWVVGQAAASVMVFK